MLLLGFLAACVSDGRSGAILGFADEPPGPNCAAGGTRVDAGRDLDGDGVLAAGEVETTTYVCDGASGPDGTDGEDGEDGDDGRDVLIRTSREPAGANCAAGGVRVDTGVDLDRDGVLDPGEITATSYVCDGVDGQDGDDARDGVAGFQLIAKLTAAGGPIAEIVVASPDGRQLAFTSSDAHTVGFVDLAEPGAPVLLGTVDVGDTVAHAGAGEPTSVAFTPDGRFALAVVKDTSDPVGRADPGRLVFIDAATRAIAGSIAVGVGPDSVHLTPDGRHAVIAIEDEENPDGNAVAQARPGSIQIVTLDLVTPASSVVRTIALTPMVGNLPTDPQPEYVDIAPDGRTAIVSLQENNLLAVVDIASASVTRYVQLGVSTHATADLTADGRYGLLAPGFVGQLQPDGVCFLADGVHVLTANEGDTGNRVFGPDLFSGGRGFSVVTTSGARVFDSGDQLEAIALRAGVYPEARSGNRGIELEGCATGRFRGVEYGFLVGERDATLFVVDLRDPAAPAVRQLLGAPMRPETVTTIPARGLVVVGGEGNGTGGGIWIYQAVTDPAAAGNGLDVYDVRSDQVPFSALSALAYEPATGLMLAVPDNAFAEPRIWSFWVDHVAHRFQLVGERILRDATGAPLTGYDPEGLAINPEGGYVVASEGIAGNGGSTSCAGSVQSNRLLFVDAGGRLDGRYGAGGIVDLPCGTAPNAIDWTTVRANGYEGVAVVDASPGAAGGLRVYVAFQRALTTEGQLTRIGEYDVDVGTWRFWFYRLDANPGGAAGATFLSELIHLGGDELAVIERDQGWAGAATNKTIRVFRLGSGTPGAIGDPVDKVTAVDLLAHRFRFDQEKLEGFTLGAGAAWVVNDNDGGQAASFVLRLDPAALTRGAPPPAPTPGADAIVLNEVDSTAERVELFNRGTTPIELAGWKLTATAPTAVLELAAGTTIAPGAHLSVALPYPLASADRVRLATPAGATVDEHAWTADVASASRCPDGTGPVFWAPTPPSPGAANPCTPPVVPGQTDLVLNEINSSGADFVELRNNGAVTVDLTGWKLTDDDPTHVLVFPAGTTIAPGGLVLIAGDTSSAPLRMTFGLGSADAAVLLTPYDVVVDQHRWTSHVATASRCPDGSGALTAPRPATPGAANSCP